MDGEPGTVLGHLTPGQLRAGGINRRGVLQPLLPAERPDPDSERIELVRDGLLRPDPISPGGWRPAGALADILAMAAVARTVISIEPGAGTMGEPARLVLSGLGTTSLALDLHPGGGRYTCVASSRDAVAASVSASLGAGSSSGTGVDAAPGGGESPGRGAVDPGPSMTDPGTGGDPVGRLQSLTVDHPDRPALQHEVLIVAGEGRPWLRIGARRGDQVGSWAAPATPERILRVVRALVRGSQVRL